MRPPLLYGFPSDTRFPIRLYNRNIADRVNFSRAYSPKQALSHVIFREGGKIRVSNAMGLFRKNSTKRDAVMKRIVVLDDNFVDEVAFDSYKGEISELEELPDVSPELVASALAKKLGGRPEEYANVVREYFKSENR